MKKVKALEIKRRTRFTLANSIRANHGHLMNDIKILEHINVILPQASDRYSQTQLSDLRKKIQYLDKKGKREMVRFVDHFRTHEDKVGEKVFLKHPETAEIVSQLCFLSILEKRIPMFIREMSLLYLVISFEEFLRIIIRNIFVHRPESLKSIRKTMPFKDILERSKRDNVIQMADIEVDDIMRLNIDQIARRLDDIFSFKLNKEPEWNKFKEVFYRRNCYVHNFGYPNESYVLTFKPRTQNGKLPIDKPYLDEAYRVFRLFVTTIEERFHRQFSGKRRSMKQKS